MHAPDQNGDKNQFAHSILPFPRSQSVRGVPAEALTLFDLALPRRLRANPESLGSTRSYGKAEISTGFGSTATTSHGGRLLPLRPVRTGYGQASASLRRCPGPIAAQEL